MTRKRFAEELGEKEHTINDIERGRQRVSDQFVMKLIGRFPITPDWLFRWSEEPASRPASQASPPKVVSFPSGHEHLTFKAEVGVPGFVPVPRYDVRLSAGPGSVGVEEVIGHMAWRRDWLDARGIDPAKAWLVEVSGDSMSPSLRDGDMVMIDGREGDLHRRAIYAFVDVDGQLRVKRLERLEDALVLTSDNPEFATEMRAPEATSQMVIVGRVVWSAHDWT